MFDSVRNVTRVDSQTRIGPRARYPVHCTKIEGAPICGCKLIGKKRGALDLHLVSEVPKFYARTFKSGREFAAFLGLVPRQSGTGGKVRLGSISKRGDPYLRTLLIHGARSVLCHAKVPTAWQKGIQERRPGNVVAVALANKMARIAWAILTHESSYEKNHVSVRPA